MAIILGVVGFILALAVVFVSEYRFDLVFFREHRLISKLMAAFFTGFIFFVLFTDKIPKVTQRVSLIFVSLLLIYANLFLGKKEEDAEGEEKD